MGISVLELQKALAARGFDPGPADGVRGRRTIEAIRAFQKTAGLEIDGLAGPATVAALFAQKGEAAAPLAAAAPDLHPWYDLALTKKGLHERRDNRRLKEFLKKGKGTPGDPALIPWCGDFVETCIALSLPSEPLPANPYAAINWLSFGAPCRPQTGAILVFWRGKPSGWQGHIGFYAGEDATHFHVLGGNQSDAVTVSRIAKSRLRPNGCRWPKTALPATGKAKHVSAGGVGETTNEA